MKVTVCAVALGFILTHLNSVDANDKKKGNTGIDRGNENLIERMENLEARDKMRENENTELKHRVLVLENIVKDQEGQILDLKGAIDKQDDANKQLRNHIQYLEGREKADDSLQTEVNSQEKRIQFIEGFIRNLSNKLQRLDGRDIDNEDPENKSRSKRTATQHIRKRDNEETVAFFAYLSDHLENPGVHQIVTFDHVVTNIGNAYNAFAGDFRAPVPGIYVFATTLMAYTIKPYHFRIMHNGQLVTSLYITNAGTSSQEVVLQLNQGDNVSIHNMDAGQMVYGHGYSTFSGFLLQQNYSSPAIVGR